MSSYYDELAVGDEVTRNGWRHVLEQWLRFEVVRRGLDVGLDEAIIDLGCGTGELQRFLGQRNGKYVGVDRFEPSIKKARQKSGEGLFLCADIFDRVVDEAGTFDYALAIGTFVNGDEEAGQKETRVEGLCRLIDRLEELGSRGWALVILDQERLERDLLRSLEPCLRGATRLEVAEALQERGIEAVIDGQVLPTDLFVIRHRRRDLDEVRAAISGDQAHESVLARMEESDFYDEAWLWANSGRAKRALRALEKVPVDDPRRTLLMGRVGGESAHVRLLGTAGKVDGES